MESLQDSWQFELSTAEYTPISQPISPAPPLSPTLYSIELPPVSNVSKLGEDALGVKPCITLDHAIESLTFDEFGGGGQQHLVTPCNPFIQENSGQSFLALGVDMASVNIMPQISVESQMPSSRQIIPQFNNLIPDDFLNDDEKSYDLEEGLQLFEDVVFMEEVRPESPLVEQEIHGLGKSPLIPKVEITNNGYITELSDQMDDNFSELIKDLGLNDSNIEIIAGIPYVYAEELSQLANEGEDLGLVSREDSMMCVDDEQSYSCSSSSSSGSESPHSPFSEVVITSDGNETELSFSNFNNIFSSFISNPSSVSNSDDEDDAQEMCLDALNRNDIETAARVINPNASRQSRGSRNSKISRLENDTRGSIAVVPKNLPILKPEKRGRKPSSAAAGKSWVHLTDKGMRKKEQNKTAATRYRQKKKMETMLSLTQEQELQGEHDELMKQKDELAKQIKMMKGLLRELFVAKKGQQGGKRR